MELYLSLLSPVWWASVLLCSIASCATGSWVARRGTERTGSEPATTTGLDGAMRRVRFGAFVVVLLVLANLAMLGTLSIANLRVPRLAGPVGLALVLCCLVSLVLALLVYRGVAPLDVRGAAGRTDASR